MQDSVGDPDLADVVEQEPVLEAGVVEQLRAVDLRELEGVADDPLGVLAGADVLGLERACESGHGLLVGGLDQRPLDALDLEQPAQVLRVEEQLLVGPLVDHQAVRAFGQPAREPLDHLEEVERAEWLAHECFGAGDVLLARVCSGQEHDGDVRGLRV